MSKNNILLIFILIILLAVIGVWYLVMGNDTQIKEEVQQKEQEISKEAENEIQMKAPAEKVDSEALADVKVNQEVMEEISDLENSLTKTFKLSGKNFSFSETEITVNRGDRVKIIFESTEGYHDWVLDEFNASTEKVREGENTEVVFIAGKKGIFEYYCSVGSHRQLGMVGKLIVK